MPPEWLKAIAAYFDSAADAYARSIEPVFRPLAQSLCEASRINPDQLILDIGTGTGLVAAAALTVSDSVIGIDFSKEMLAIAQQRIPSRLVRGDIHAMPFMTNQFDVALASFAFNSSDPITAFAETHRILHPSGRLFMQEWGAADDISEMTSDLFAEYMVDDPPPHLEQLREQVNQPLPWDDLESIEALTQALQDAGFRSIEVQELTPQVVLPNVEAFLRYKLAWPSRTAELEAMPDDVRALCLSDLRENIAPYRERDTGQMIWKPNIVRISASK